MPPAKQPWHTTTTTTKRPKHTTSVTMALPGTGNLSEAAMDLDYAARYLEDTAMDLEDAKMHYEDAAMHYEDAAMHFDDTARHILRVGGASRARVEEQSGSTAELMAEEKIERRQKVVSSQINEIQI
jgi:hypothetical protein